MSYFFTLMPSPLGELQLIANESALIQILWDTQRDEWHNKPLVQQDTHPVLTQTADELDEYFSGHRTDFTIPLHMEGTAFQQEVWKALQTIPYGVTISYAELAERVGNPRAMRAVGSANGRNPISIIVPCHRVIASDSSLGGYGGGLSRKQLLLELEGATVRNGMVRQAA